MAKNDTSSICHTLPWFIWDLAFHPGALVPSTPYLQCIPDIYTSVAQGMMGAVGEGWSLGVLHMAANCTYDDEPPVNIFTDAMVMLMTIYRAAPGRNRNSQVSLAGRYPEGQTSIVTGRLEDNGRA